MEYKINFTASGERLVARGEVVTAGRRLFVCKAEVLVVVGGEQRPCVTLLQTVTPSPNPPERPNGDARHPADVQSG